MKKMVLLPYDRYTRLLSDSKPPSQESAEEQIPIKDDTENSTVEQLLTQPDSHSINKESDDIDRLITYFPKTLQERARILLSYIKPYLKWNDKGEVSISGQIIPDSNIVDLIKVQLKDYKNFHPVGIDQFQNLLSQQNVPLSLLTVSKRIQTGTGVIPPPPGVPVKRKTLATIPKKIKWLKL